LYVVDDIDHMHGMFDSWLVLWPEYLEREEVGDKEREE
jgi:hypothetical protein